MKKCCSYLLGFFFSSYIHASDSFNSEASHFMGGAALAGGITAAVDQMLPEYRENRAEIGFWVSSIGIVITQLDQYQRNGNAKSQALDAVAHILGSAAGAYLVDGYALEPLIKDSSSEGKYIGLAFVREF